MSFPSTFDISTGSARGWSSIFKFGRNPAVGTEFVPICSNGIYRTPQAADASKVRVRSGGSAADDVGGSGAHSVRIEGLDASGGMIGETIATAGADQSADSVWEFLRIFRVYVVDSGTYASQTSASHAGDIVIETVGGDEWARISGAGFPRGQSQIGAYSIPKCRTAFITSVSLSTQSNKTVDLNFYTRESILDAGAPFSAMRLKRELVGITGNDNTIFNVPLGPFPELTDIGFMARVDSQTADVSVDFTIALRVG